MTSVSQASRGNPWCFVAPKYGNVADTWWERSPRTFEKCCRSSLAYDSCWGKTIPELMGVAAHTMTNNVFFSWDKCCKRNVSARAFHGFVSPLEYEIQELPTHHPRRGNSLDAITVLLPAYPSFRLVASNYGEPAALVASEIDRFRKNRAEFEREVALRKQAYSPGGKSGVGSLPHMFTVEVLHIIGNCLDAAWQPIRTFMDFGSAEDGEPIRSLITRIRGPWGSPGARNGTAWIVAVEADVALCASYRRSFPEAAVLCEAVTPVRLWEMMDTFFPRTSSRGLRRVHVDLLKVDIDSFDCEVAEMLLQGNGKLVVRPRIIVLEVNEAIPPPFRQVLRYSASLMGVKSLWQQECKGLVPINGCSLAYQVYMLRKYGYYLAYVVDNNAVFVDRTVLSILDRAGEQVPLNEFDSYQQTYIKPGCVSARQLRRWFYEIPVVVARTEISQHLERLIRLFGLPTDLRLSLDL